MPNPNEQLVDEALRKIKEIQRTPLLGTSEEADRIAEVVTALVRKTLPPKPQSND